MIKINFKNGASGKTPLNATNLNKMQDNIEEATMINKISLQGNSVQEGTPSVNSEVPIKSVGDNINLLDRTTFKAGYTIDKTTGELDVYNTCVASEQYIAVKPNTTYTYSSHILIGTLRISQYGNDKTHIERIAAGNLNIDVKKFTFTTPSNCYYVRCSFNYDNTTTVTAEILETLKLKLEEGSKETPYSPYGQGSIGITIGNGTTSKTKSLHTQQPFRAIGDVRDRFIKEDGVWYEEHNVSELVLNGTESWSVAKSLSSNLLLQIEITNLADLQSVDGIVSDYFIGTNGDFIWNANDGKYYIAGNSSNKIRISLNTTKFPTISSFTEWLKTNNVKVYYQLATPTLIECTPEQVEVLNDIYSAYGEGMTNIICNDEIEPVIEIVKETKETVQSENDKAISLLLARIEELEKKIQ